MLANPPKDQDDTFQLEAFSSVLLGSIAYVIEKSHDAWMPYEFLPGTLQSRVLICGDDKRPFLREDWRIIFQNPSITDWSLFCSIFKHLTSPSLIYITRDVMIPQKALEFLQKNVQSCGASVIIERTEQQIGTITMSSATTIFLPVVTTRNIQQRASLYRAILGHIPAYKSVDLGALLTQISYNNLALIVGSSDVVAPASPSWLSAAPQQNQQKWSLYWYKPDESRMPELPQKTIVAILNSVASLLDAN